MVLDGRQESFSAVTFKLVPTGRGASQSAYGCEEQRDHPHCSAIPIEWEHDMKRG